MTPDDDRPNPKPRAPARLSLLACVCALVIGGAADGRQTPVSVQDEVLANIRNIRVGDHTLDAYGLPEAFLRRIADRVIRESYQARFHGVYRDAKAAPDAPAPAPATATVPAPETGDAADTRCITVVRPSVSESVLAAPRAYPEARPPLRGFRAPIGALARDPAPFDLPATALPASHRACADIVAQRLSRDGLLATLALVLDRLVGAESGSSIADRTAGEIATTLRDVGFPVDLLEHFPTRPEAGRGGLVAMALRRLADGASADTLRAELESIPFRFSPTRADFVTETESGERDIGRLRLQLTRGTYWKGIGAGGSLDIARQLAERLPGVSFTVSIEERFLDPFLAIARGWPLTRPGQLQVVAEPLVVAQWAQDNGKNGVVEAKHAPGGLIPATIVPRYASRREDGSVFVPGETFLLDGLSQAGHVIVHSPLLFQGGNLLAVRDPSSGRRILLVGEAEIHRNTALGLTPEQVREAFRAEFAVDDLVALPSVSFHIDYDVTVRASGGRLLAFVNDRDTALRMILAAGVDALERHGMLDPGSAQSARRHLETGEGLAFLEIVARNVYGRRAEPGGYPLSLAQAFGVDPVDSPVGNLQRFLAALDILASRAVPDERQTTQRNVRGYLRAFRRADAERGRLHAALREAGFVVIPVPGLAEGDRSIVHVNGIHDRTRYLMPAYGGLFADLDEAAAQVFREHLGPEVEVIPVLCGETQRRFGALHCAAAAHSR